MCDYSKTGCLIWRLCLGWCVPSNHENVYRRPLEWAKICNCADCQRPVKQAKEALENAIKALN